VSMTTPTSTRGRPRDASVDERTLAAVVEELATVGVAGFSVNSVSARAKASKRSIVSRWPDRHALIVAGMNTLAAGLVPPHSGDLSTDLQSLAGRIADFMAEPRRSILARCAAELREYPEYYAQFKRESIDRCLAAVQDVLVDARARGQVSPGLDLAQAAEFFVSALVGGFALTSADSAQPPPIERLVDLVTNGISPRDR
jgi:AcrR family transcriptional regulator